MTLKLLVFAACEKVIVGEDDKLTSLIALIEQITVQVIEDLPVDAVFPMSWNVCALWHREGGAETPQVYRQRFEIVRPDNEIAAHGFSVFEVNNAHTNFRNVIRLSAFPIGLSGVYRLRLLIQLFGQDEWAEAGEYPIEVIHKRVESMQQPQAEANAEKQS
jgi:hypothetical protein